MYSVACRGIVDTKDWRYRAQSLHVHSLMMKFMSHRPEQSRSINNYFFQDVFWLNLCWFAVYCQSGDWNYPPPMTTTTSQSEYLFIQVNVPTVLISPLKAKHIGKLEKVPHLNIPVTQALMKYIHYMKTVVNTNFILGSGWKAGQTALSQRWQQTFSF